MAGHLIDPRFGVRLARVTKQIEDKGVRTFVTQRRGLAISPTIIGKAAVEAGTYPTVQSWSESLSKQQTWQFQLGSLSSPGSDATPRSPGSYWTATSPASFVTAYNLSQYHYVPQNAYVAIWRWQGSWYFDRAMPQTILGTLDSNLYGDSTALMTTSAFGIGSKVQVTLAIVDAYGFLLAGTKVYASLIEGSSEPRYDVIAVQHCPSEGE